MYKILVTCPPMIGIIEKFEQDFKDANFDVTIPHFTQEMSENDLCKIIDRYDGWIIGDDPATRRVLEVGKKGKLKACMRWGVGTNNIDFQAFSDLKVPIENTPGVFGREVADLACHYVIALSRETFRIDHNVRMGKWHKPTGRSLWNMSALVVGFGDIGQNLTKRLIAHEVKVKVCDPFIKELDEFKDITNLDWPKALSDVDIVIFTAPLTNDTYHMFNKNCLRLIKRGIKIVNVARGQLIDQKALVEGFDKDLIHSAALDVFEKEPFHPEKNLELMKYSDRLIFGSHNGSNTIEAVTSVSKLCIKKLKKFLNEIS